MTTTLLAALPSPPQGVWHWHILGLSIPIRAYALFIIVGIIVALVIGDRRWAARGGEPGAVYDIALWAVPFGLIGGRLYHVMTDWRTYFGDEGLGLLAAVRIWDGGLGIWGAVALGGVGAWIGCRLRGIPLPAFGDAIAPGIVLAQAIGRLGNYFNQELFGRPTSLPWGLKIYERRDASGALDMLNGVSTGQPADIAPQPVHPTFLYELIWNVLVFVLLIYVDRRFKLGHGRLFALYVAAYCVGRFGVELLRDDTATLIAGIRINSFTSTFVFLGAVVYIILAPKGREDPATLAAKPHELKEKEPEAVEAKGGIPLESGDSALVEWTRELAAVASTTGVVAGVVVAAENDGEDSSSPAGGDGSRDADADAETAALVSADASDSEDAVGEQAEPSDGEPTTDQVTGESAAEAEAESTGEAVEEPVEEAVEPEEPAAAPEPALGEAPEGEDLTEQLVEEPVGDAELGEHDGEAEEPSTGEVVEEPGEPQAEAEEPAIDEAVEAGEDAAAAEESAAEVEPAMGEVREVEDLTEELAEDDGEPQESADAAVEKLGEVTDEVAAAPEEPAAESESDQSDTAEAEISPEDFVADIPEEDAAEAEAQETREPEDGAEPEVSGLQAEALTLDEPAAEDGDAEAAEAEGAESEEVGEEHDEPKPIKAVSPAPSEDLAEQAGARTRRWRLPKFRNRRR